MVPRVTNRLDAAVRARKVRLGWRSWTCLQGGTTALRGRIVRGWSETLRGPITLKRDLAGAEQVRMMQNGPASAHVLQRDSGR